MSSLTHPGQQPGAPRPRQLAAAPEVQSGEAGAPPGLAANAAAYLRWVDAASVLDAFPALEVEALWLLTADVESALTVRQRWQLTKACSPHTPSPLQLCVLLSEGDGGWQPEACPELA